MVTVGNRRCGNPLLIQSGSSVVRPRRLPLNERMLDEGWLQELIRANPDLLPIAEIEPAFAPAIAIGREVATNVGPIDNMFLSPQGYLTIVETKLWRNPEARREVVGQIIDYAKDVSHWTFEELEKRVTDYNRRYRDSNHGALDSLRLSEQIEETEEQFLVDTISRNLKQGRFLLLVVGDGIRESVEGMADFLQQVPHLLFTLALVELQVYEVAAAGDKWLLVIPQIVARTREITRAVVRVQGAVESVHVTVDTDTRVNETGAPRRYTLTEEDFFNALAESVDQADLNFAQRILDDMRELHYEVEWKQASFVVKLPEPGGSGQKLTMFIVNKQGQVHVGWLPGQLKNVGLDHKIGLEFVYETARVFENCEPNPKYPDWWSRPVSLGELRQRYQEFVAIVRNTVDRIKEAPVAEPMP